MTSSRAWLVAALAMLAAATLRGTPRDATEIAVTGRANAYPSVIAAGPLVAVAFGASTPDGSTDVFAAVSRDSGRSFATPVRVNAIPANLSGEQPPAIALVPAAGGEPSLVVVWTSKSPDGTKLLSSRSDDGGKTFAAATPVPGSEGAGNRGWESIAAARDGHVMAVWLDHRELASSGSMAMGAHHEHATGEAGKTDAVARAQRSKILFAQLDAAGDARPISGGVCYCCKTALAAGANGGIVAAWRQVYAGNIRDIAFARSADGGRTFTTPERVSEDNWMLDGCPENGPSLVVDRHDGVHVVWPTLLPAADANSEPTLALFYATSTHGKAFTPRARVPTEGMARHPQIALGPKDELLIVWDEQDGGVRRVAAARATPNGSDAVRFVRQPLDDPRSASYPGVASAADADVVAWTSGGPGATVIRVARIAR